MDEETRAAFAEMTQRMNDQFERVLNRLSALEQDFQTTKGFLVGDALVSGRRWLDLEARVADLERKREG